MKAYALSLNDSCVLNQWDSGFILDMLSDLNISVEKVDKIPVSKRAIVLLPARHHAGREKEINYELSKIGNAVFFCIGDEEAEFNLDKIQANHIWVQNPHPSKHDKYNRIGTGYPQHLRPVLEHSEKIEKKDDMYFSGQITHSRRKEMWKYIENYPNVNRTLGFTRGTDPIDYLVKMAEAKVAPCPSGAVIPDSFRLFEALECMTIPIADEISPDGTINGYWDWLFNEITPFPKIKEWVEVGSKIQESVNDYNRLVQKQTCWWMLYKRNFKLKLMEQLNG